jgi:predicted amidohydrolase
LRTSRIEKIGFFHCVDFSAPASPVTRLRKTINDRINEEKGRDPGWTIANSLIVFPEAFNIDEYGSRSPAVPADEFLAALRLLAEEHQIVFVAGILDGRRNSAYIIDAKLPHLMCHKVGDDRTGVDDPCTGDPDPCNPVTFSNACVGALICMDATSNNDRSIGHRRARLLKRLKAGEGSKIICVPSRFQRENPDLLVRLPQVADLHLVRGCGRIMEAVTE